MSEPNGAVFRSKQVIELTPVQRFPGLPKTLLNADSESEDFSQADQSESTASLEPTQLDSDDVEELSSESEDEYSISPLRWKGTERPQSQVFWTQPMPEFSGVRRLTWQDRMGFLSASKEGKNLEATTRRKTLSEDFRSIDSDNEPGKDNDGCASALSRSQLEISEDPRVAQPIRQTASATGKTRGVTPIREPSPNGTRNEKESRKSETLHHAAPSLEEVVVPEEEVPRALTSKRFGTADATDNNNKVPERRRQANGRFRKLDNGSKKGSRQRRKQPTGDRQASQPVEREPSPRQLAASRRTDKTSKVQTRTNGVGNTSLIQTEPVVSPQVSHVNSGQNVFQIPDETTHAIPHDPAGQSPSRKPAAADMAPGGTAALEVNGLSATTLQPPQALESSPPFMRQTALRAKATLISVKKSGKSNQSAEAVTFKRTAQPSSRSKLHHPTRPSQTASIASSNEPGASVGAAPAANVAANEDVLAGFFKPAITGQVDDNDGREYLPSPSLPVQEESKRASKARLKAKRKAAESSASYQDQPQPRSTEIASLECPHCASPAKRLRARKSNNPTAEPDSAISRRQRPTPGRSSCQPHPDPRRTGTTERLTSGTIVQEEQEAEQLTAGSEQQQARPGSLDTEIGLLLKEIKAGQAGLKSSMEESLSAVRATLGNEIRKQQSKDNELLAFLTSHTEAVSKLAAAYRAV